MSVAQRLRQKLLDLAIHGKLVPQCAKDEPAGELLVRIRKARLQLLSAKGVKKEDQIIPVGDDEVPFELPKEWTWCRFRELGILTGGHTPSMANPKFWNGDVLWVTSKDMKRKYIEDTGAKITALGADELTTLEPGAVLMCTRSGILRRTFPVAIAAKELTINQDQRALTLALPEMAEYVYSALCALEPLILAEYRKTGTTVESIIWEKFIDMPFPLPPLAEQKRIVEKLNEMLKEATRVAEGTERLAQLRKKAKAKILDLAIRGKLVKQEELGMRNEELGIGNVKRYPPVADDEKLFDLPKGWEWRRLGEISEIITGATPSTKHPEYFNGEIPFVKPADIGESDCIATTHDTLTLEGLKTVRSIPAGSICVCCIGSIGKAGIATKTCCTNQQINSVISQAANNEYLYYAILSDYFQTRLRESATAITIALVNKSSMSTIPIPLPPLAEQKRIVAKVKEMLAACEELRIRN